MKLFLTTIGAGTLHESAIVFIKAFGRYYGRRMSSGSHELIGRADATLNYSHWDNIPNSLRLHQTLDTLECALREWVDARYGTGMSLSLREVTADEHRWFMTKGLHVYIANALDDAVYDVSSNTRTRLRVMVNSMTRRANPPPLVAHYKGASLSANAYKDESNFCKMMGQLIREAIQTNDASHCEEVFVDNYDMDSELHHTVFNAMSQALSDKGLSLRNEVLYCDHIGERDGRVRVSGRLRYFCQNCMDNDDVVVYAHDTDEHIARGDAYYDEYQDHWLSEEPDSDSDDSDSDSDPYRLMSYSTNALDHVEKDHTITSAPFGNFLMGVELEMVTRGSISEAVDNVRSELGEDYCICKSDGSLPDGGIEIVTAPRGLDEHISTFKGWEISSDYSAWKNNRCGMHVHIDSRAFTSLTLGKFIMLMNANTNAEFIRKIAGRHPLMDSQARSYCRTENQSELSNPSKALKGKSGDRYTIVNTTCLRNEEARRLGVNYVGERKFNTVELRIFRASLKKERLLAQIEFTHAAVMFCRVASMRDLDGVSFLKWLKTTDNRYPHLADWYGVRRRPTAKNAEPTETKCEDVVPPAQPTEIRHSTNYPLVINPGDDTAQFIDRSGLHAEYGDVHGTSVMHFPYAGTAPRIDADDVVYTLDPDTYQWRLQPVGALANVTTSETI